LGTIKVKISEKNPRKKTDNPSKSRDEEGLQESTIARSRGF
jgi:hypothetical protein